MSPEERIAEISARLKWADGNGTAGRLARRELALTDVPWLLAQLRGTADTTKDSVGPQCDKCGSNHDVRAVETFLYCRAHWPMEMRR